MGDDCYEVLREVELYLDGELAVEQVQVVERHLTTCSPCLRRVEFRQELRALVARKCGQERAPHSLSVRIQEMLRVEGPRQA